METIGKIRGFGSYTPQHLEQMKQDLKISMTIPQLQYCASYYRTQEKRDPGIDELKMLDDFVASYPIFASPIELLTNDACVAETYADLMQKRRTLNPNANYPCDLSEMLGMADGYLTRAGKPRTLLSGLFTVEDNKCGIAVKSAVTVNGADFGISKIAECKGKEPQKGDLILIMRQLESDKNGIQQKNGNGFWRDSEVTKKLLQISKVSSGGLLHTLLLQVHSLWIDLSRLSVLGEPIPLSMLCTAYIGDCLVRIAKSDYEEVQKKACEYGLRAQAFASVTDGNRYTVVRNKAGDSFSLSYSFLRTLIPYRPVKVCLSDESSTARAPIRNVVLSDTCSAYLNRKILPTHVQIAELDGTLCSVAACAPQNSFFGNAIDTLLAPILALSAAGIDYAQQRLTIGLKLPKKQSDITCASASVSALLGIYRLQAELGIPSTYSTMLLDDTPFPRLTAGAVGNGQPILPSSFSENGNRIYCLEPERDGNGLPHFNSLRKLLDYLAALRRKGVLRSAYVLCRESVTSGLQKMRTRSLGIRLTGDEWACEDKIRLAVLIETTQQISAKQVGTVMAREAAFESKMPMLPPNRSLIRTPTPTLTVVSHKTDNNAMLLCEKLTEKGACVTHLTPTDTAALSLALLSAQTLILCTDTALEGDTALEFARDTFLASGGRVLLLGKVRCHHFANSVSYPYGFSEEILEKLANNK